VGIASRKNAETLDVTERTVQRDWEKARLILAVCCGERQSLAMRVRRSRDDRSMRLSISQMAVMSPCSMGAADRYRPGGARGSSGCRPNIAILLRHYTKRCCEEEGEAARLRHSRHSKLGFADPAGAVEASRYGKPGAHIGPYELIRPLGAGGMAEYGSPGVPMALQTRDGVEVANAEASESRS